MTLIELLTEVAREIDCPVSDLCTAEDDCVRRPMARDLRDAARRLREEMEELQRAVSLDPTSWASHMPHELRTLERINNGPGVPRLSPPTPTKPCEPWCGTRDWPDAISHLVWFNGMCGESTVGFCTPACRDAGRPLNPRGTGHTPEGRQG